MKSCQFRDTRFFPTAMTCLVLNKPSPAHKLSANTTVSAANQSTLRSLNLKKKNMKNTPLATDYRGTIWTP